MTRQFIFFSLCCAGLFFAGVLAAQSEIPDGFPFTERVYLKFPSASEPLPPAATEDPNVPGIHYFDTTNMPALPWNRLSWATRYDIEVDDDPAFNAPAYSHATTPLETDALEHTLTMPLNDGTWFWRVRGVGADGAGSFSPPQHFVVDVLPECPSLAFNCSQLTSCEEAMACLQAGNFTLDPDANGIPCESNNLCPSGRDVWSMEDAIGNS